MLKEANLVLHKAPELQLFYLLDFPGDSERLYRYAIFVWSSVIALCTEGERSVFVGMVERGMRYEECVGLMSLGVQLCVCEELFICLFYPVSSFYKLQVSSLVTD